MQKFVRTVDGQGVYINVEPIYDNKNQRWMEDREIRRSFPFPRWHLIYDLQQPAAEVGGITVGDGGSIILHAAGQEFKINGRQFMELLRPNDFFGRGVMYPLEHVGRELATVLALLWQERTEAAMRENTEREPYD